MHGGARKGSEMRSLMARTVRGASTALALAPLLLAAPLGAAEPGSELSRAWAAGYRAGFTCSALWNGAGKALAEIERDELTNIYPEIEADIRTLKAELPAGERRVEVRYSSDMPPRIAKWIGREGCVTLPIGSPASSAPDVASAPRADHDRSAWPLGERGAARPDARFSALGSEIGRLGGRTSSLLVVKDGKIAFEHYWLGHSAHTAQRSFSVAKSIASTLVGHGVLEGAIDVAAPAGIAEWQARGDARRAITTEQLLRMASGLASDTAGNRTDAIYMGGALVRPWTTHWPLLHPPGSRYRYANNDTLLAVLSLKSAMAEKGRSLDPAAFLDAIGMTRTFAERDAAGDYILSSQVSTTARDLARLGLLYEANGVFEGKRYLPETWRAFVTTPSGPQPQGPFGYGAGFWLLDRSEGVPADAFGAFGNRGQFLVIIPSRRLVIVRQGYDDARERLDIAALVRAVVAAADQSIAG